MEKQYNSNETIINDQAKLDWNTPEIEVLPINEKTLAGGPGVVDLGVFS